MAEIVELYPEGFEMECATENCECTYFRVMVDKPTDFKIIGVQCAECDACYDMNGNELEIEFEPEF